MAGMLRTRTASSGCRPGTTTTPSSPIRRREISLIYYNNRGGLEDRVFRIKTDRSSATSLPEAPHRATTSPTSRSSSQTANSVEVRFNWFTLYYRYQNIDPYFGTAFYTHRCSAAREPVIKKKKVVLKNDYIHHVVDIYHI